MNDIYSSNNKFLDFDRNNNLSSVQEDICKNKFE